MARPRLISDEQILTMMRRRVITDGPSVSLDAVAAELGVSTAAVLKRFKSRQALMLAALSPPPNPEWIVWLMRGPDDRPLTDQLRELFELAVSFMDEVVPCITALRESGIPMDKVYPAKVKPPERGLVALTHWLTQARQRNLIQTDDLETAAYAILGALQARAFFSHILKKRYSTKAQRAYAAELAQFMSRALTVSASGPFPLAVPPAPHSRS